MTANHPADPWDGYDADPSSTPAPVARPLRLAFYGRCSTEDNQDPETSRQWQRRAADNLLATVAPGAEVVAEYFDVGESRALPWKRRTEAQRLLSDLDDPSRDWDGIVVGEGQRCWYGSQFAEVAPVVEHRHVSLYVPELGGRYDPANASHYTLMTLTGGMSRGERQRVQARVRTGMAAQVAQQGRYQGGRPPYGYVAEPYAPHPNPRKAAEGYMLKRLALDPEVAPVVARIFSEYLDHRSLRTIAAGLNLDKIDCPSAHDRRRNRHRRADGWQPSTVRAILANARYTGYEEWGKFHKAEVLVNPNDASWGYATRLVRSEEAPVRSLRPAHEPIVSVEEFRAVQQRLASRSAGGNRGQARLQRRSERGGGAYALSGMIACALCGRKMYGEKAPRKNSSALVRYRCRRRDMPPGTPAAAEHPESVRLGQDVLLDLVGGWLAGLFAPERREATITAVLAAGTETATPESRQRAEQARRLEDARTRQARLLALVENGVDPSTVAARVSALDAEIVALAVEAGNMHPVQAAPALTRGDIDGLLTDLAAVQTRLFGPAMDPSLLRGFFEAIGLNLAYDITRRRLTAALAVPTGGHAEDQSHGLRSVRGGT